MAGAGRARASVLLAREEDDREEAVMGWAIGAGPVGGRQVSPGGFSLSFFLFSIFCNWFSFDLKYQIIFLKLSVNFYVSSES